MTRQTSIKLTEDRNKLLEKYKALWGGQTDTIFTALERLDAQYRLGARIFNDLFTQDEKDFLKDCMLNKKAESFEIPYIIQDEIQAIPDSVFSIRGISKALLIDKLLQLHLGEHFSLVCWIESLKKASHDSE